MELINWTSQVLTLTSLCLCSKLLYFTLTLDQTLIGYEPHALDNLSLSLCFFRTHTHSPTLNLDPPSLNSTALVLSRVLCSLVVRVFVCVNKCVCVFEKDNLVFKQRSSLIARFLFLSLISHSSLSLACSSLFSTLSFFSLSCLCIFSLFVTFDDDAS